MTVITVYVNLYMSDKYSNHKGVNQMNQHYISIRHLSKKFSKDFVLKDVNAELGKGEILGFLGPSGAGKTSLLTLVCLAE